MLNNTTETILSETILTEALRTEAFRTVTIRSIEDLQLADMQRSTDAVAIRYAHGEKQHKNAQAGPVIAAAVADPLYISVRQHRKRKINTTPNITRHIDDVAGSGTAMKLPGEP